MLGYMAEFGLCIFKMNQGHRSEFSLHRWFFLFPQLTCEKVLELMNFIVPPPQETSKHREEQSKVKPKFRKGLYAHVHI